MVFNRWGTYIRDIDPSELIDAKRKVVLNGEDSITIRTTQMLTKGMRIVWRDEMSIWHEHVVATVDETHDGAGDTIREAWCENSWCELRGDYIVDKRPGVRNPCDARTALTSALSSSRWTVGTVDVAKTGGASMYHCSAWDAVSTVVGTWGGELRADITVNVSTGVTSRKLSLLTHLGNTSNQITRRFEWDSDITSISRKVDETDVITACYGWGQGEELENEDGGTSYGRRIGIADVNPTGLPYVVDNVANQYYGRGDGAYVFGNYVNEECSDPNTLLAETTAYLAENSTPHVVYNASVAQFAAAGADLTGVAIGDEVQVVDRAFVPELRITARVLELEYDMLDNSDMSVTLGNYNSDISTYALSTSRALSTLSNKSAGWDAVQSASAAYVESVISQLNSLFDSAGGYVTIDTSTGITVVDNPTNPSMAIQINGAGFRIANTKTQSGAWNWRTFGTGDGFTSDEIITGTLSAGKITDVGGNNYWDLDSGEFNLSSTTTVNNQSFDDYISENVEIDYSKIHLSQQQVFNALTNNGANQGIYLSNGELYINGTYIQSGYVSANVIAAKSITGAKLADGTVTATQIANAAIDTAQIKNGAITDAKITNLSASKINAGTLSADYIESYSIVAASIGSDANHQATIGDISTGAGGAAENGLIVKDTSSGGSPAIGLATNSNGLFMFTKPSSANYFTPNMSLSKDGYVIFETPQFSGYTGVSALEVSPTGLQAIYHTSSSSNLLSATIPNYGTSYRVPFIRMGSVTFSNVANGGTQNKTASFTPAYTSSSTYLVFIEPHGSNAQTRMKIDVTVERTSGSSASVHLYNGSGSTIGTMVVSYVAIGY